MSGVSPKTDVLIVTVNKVESLAVMDAFQRATGKDPYPTIIDNRTYHDLGKVNGARIFLALSEMGASGLGASQQVIQKGISALCPSAVIAVGIAFGVDEQKQAIGDILVSKQLWLYDLQRIGKEIISRGDKTHASTKLIDRFRNADLNWSGAKVHFGLILTGDKLIDNIDYRDELRKFEPEAVGGEMEGAGLYVACQDAHVDWILVKAICDWADGNKTQDKDTRQQLAARNAAQFVIHMLELTPFNYDLLKSGLPTPPSSKLNDELDINKLEFPRIQDILYKNEVIDGKFFRAEPAWVDFEQGYILNRDEIDEVIDNLEFNKIQLLIGDSGSGKSIILKAIGLKLSQYKPIYYIESKKYDDNEVGKYLKEILQQNENAIFILDDIHIHQKVYENFLSNYKKLEKVT
jgi:nucleoside phosphorylase